MPYQDKTLQLIDQLPNGKHSFFSEICSSIGTSIRFTLRSVLEAVPNELAQYWSENLHSFDNALLFQSVSEMLSFSELQNQGWSAKDYDSQTKTINLSHKTGQLAKLLCISFLCEQNLKREQELSTLLETGLEESDTTYKLALIYRRAPQSKKSVQQALYCFKNWLQSNPKTYETTYFRDEHNWIECKILPSGAFHSEKAVQIIQNALCSSFILEQIDDTAHLALEQIRLQQLQDVPVILSIVGSQEFQITPNSWRFFFYGPTSQALKATYRHDADQMRGWMHDPFRTFLTGVLRIECRFLDKKKLKVSSFENPWSEFSGFGSKLPPPRLQLLGKENLDPILGRVAK